MINPVHEPIDSSKIPQLIKWRLCEESKGFFKLDLGSYARKDNYTMRLAAKCVTAEQFVTALEMLETRVIHVLSLYYCCIGDNVAKAVGKLLKVNPYIRELVLSSNQIGPMGAIAISEGLRDNRTLESLSLNQNDCRNTGTQAIAKAVATHPSLKTLFLGDNSIGFEGMSALADMLKTNRSLRRLDLRNLDSHSYTEADQKAIIEATAFIRAQGINRTLEKVEMDPYFPPASGRLTDQRIHDNLAHNQAAAKTAEYSAICSTLTELLRDAHGNHEMNVWRLVGDYVTGSNTYMPSNYRPVEEKPQISAKSKATNSEQNTMLVSFDGQSTLSASSNPGSKKINRPE